MSTETKDTMQNFITKISKDKERLITQMCELAINKARRSIKCELDNIVNLYDKEKYIDGMNIVFSRLTKGIIPKFLDTDYHFIQEYSEHITAALEYTEEYAKVTYRLKVFACNTSKVDISDVLKTLTPELPEPTRVSEYNYHNYIC